ncbi:MAG TPA: M18 family aminopeptidase [Egibacteraceae bacterium]|nr:M18 family aminopeptidase [Egibacteraceae bacterium]
MAPDRRPADDLCAFVDAGPSPYHAVAEMVRRLETAGFTPLDERDRWDLRPGVRRYVVRDGGSLAAFRVGSRPPSAAGFRLVGGHTDSPALKVRPRPDIGREGYRLVGTEPYGRPLLHTWMDRDLTLAGRVALRRPDGSVGLQLVRLDGVRLRVPSLAIHLDRRINEEGLKLDPQRHLVPLWGLGGDDPAGPGLLDAVADQAGVERAAILGHDLFTADTQPAASGGDDGFVFAPRLDNLASCHAGLLALTQAAASDHTQVLVCNDHEEVGSASAEGAAGPFLEDLLRRVVAVCEGPDPEAFPIAAARSRLVSADTAHAVHPNYAERHEPGHRPRFGGGPVLKANANQSYATDAGSGAWFASRCADAGVSLQHFVVRADLPCGSTIGPLTAARLGVSTVDVGIPLLSMHSCREQAAAADIGPMVAALTAHLEQPGD